MLRRRTKIREKAREEREQAIQERAQRATANRVLVTVRKDAAGTPTQDKLQHNLEVLKALQEEYFRQHPEEYEKYLKEMESMGHEGVDQLAPPAADGGDDRNIGGCADVQFSPNAAAPAVEHADGKTQPQNG